MPPLPTTNNRSVWPIWLLLTGLVAYSTILWPHTVVVPGGSDSSGYFNLAKLLAEGQVQAPMRTLPSLPAKTLPPFAYTPLGFTPEILTSSLVPTYPIGLPLFFAASTRLIGAEHGPRLVLILHSLAGVLLVFALARTAGCSPGSAVLAAALVALSPLTLLYSLQAMSDLPAMVWVAAAVWLAWRRPASVWSALMAGFALGVAVLVRPSNALAFLPVVAALGWSWRRWLQLGLGGLPCALLLAWFNHTEYGSVFASGYGELPLLISLQWVPGTLIHYAKWLPVVASPLVVLALGLPGLTRDAGRSVLVLGLWIVPGLGFYAAYYHTHETWWYLRFVLPNLPALAIAALLVGERLIARLRTAAARRAVWLIITLIIAGSHRYWSKHWDIISASPGERVYPAAAEWVQSHLPPEAVVFSMQVSGALYYYTDHVLLRWDTLDASWPVVRDGLIAAKRPVYGVFFEFEEKPAMEEKIPGRWTKIGQMHQVGIWRLDLESIP